MSSPLQSPQATPRSRFVLHLLLLAAPTLVVVVLAGIAMQIRRSTAFDLRLTVSQVAFASASQQEALLLDKTAFAGLTMLGAERGEIQRGLVRADSGGASAPLRLPVTLSARDPRGATVIFAGAAPDPPAAGELDRLFLSPGGRAELAITPETPPALSLRVLDQASRILLSLRGAWDMNLLGVKVETGASASRAAAGSALRLEAPEDGSFVELWSVPAGYTLVLPTTADDAPTAPLVSNLRVSQLELQTLGPSGEAVSTIAGDGTIGFPDAPKAAEVAVKPGDFVVLGGAESFWIRKLELQPERHSLSLEAGGVAESLASGPAGGIQEHARTWFDSIWNQPRSVQLFALAVWLFPTTLAARRLLKELRQ